MYKIWNISPLLLYTGVFLTILIGAGSYFLSIFLKKIKRKCYRMVDEKFKDKKIICEDRCASYFGSKNLKKKRFRGNGVLILTKEELFFRMFLPEMEISIPLQRIKGVSTPSVFLGKTIFKPLLKIDYETKKGCWDSVAWYVRNLKIFKNFIESQIKSDPSSNSF